jgi:hypothetical protein
MQFGPRRISALGVSFVFHVIAAVVITWLTPARTLLRAERPLPPVVLVQASKTPEEAPPSSKTFDSAVDTLGIQLEEGAPSNFSLPEFRVDFGKIAKGASRLFPFLTETASLDALMARSSGGGIDWAGLFRRLRGESKPPLVLTSDAMQTLLDKSWSRRNRWQGFQVVAAASDVYDPDLGSLPALFKGYVVQNGLQPYEERTVRDPRLWVQLGLAADHADFIDFISQYAAEHPSSKTTTELLFLTDKLAQASLDALLTLITTNPPDDLQWTRQVDTRAYNALVTIRDHYVIQMDRRGLKSAAELVPYYDERRLAILQHILRTTPRAYRASDARFLAGEIYWRQGRRDDAFRMWGDMTPDPDNVYTDASAELLDALRGGSQPSARDVRWILDRERGRWITFSMARLRRFGYQLNTF